MVLCALDECEVAAERSVAGLEAGSHTSTATGIDGDWHWNDDHLAFLLESCWAIGSDFNLAASSLMSITIDAVVENGLLRPIEPLSLNENQRVRITIEPALTWVEQSYGLCGWQGNAEELRRLALSPQLDLEDEP